MPRSIYHVKIPTPLGPPGLYEADYDVEIRPYLSGQPGGCQNATCVLKDWERAEVLQKIGKKSAGRCWYCGCGLEGAVQLAEGWDYTARPNSRQVDHKVSRARGGSDHLKNLVLACMRCNNTADPGKGHLNSRDYNKVLLDRFYRPRYRNLVFWGEMCEQVVRMCEKKEAPEKFERSLRFFKRSNVALHVFSAETLAVHLMEHASAIVAGLKGWEGKTFTEADLLEHIEAIRHRKPTDTRSFLAVGAERGWTLP